MKLKEVLPYFDMINYIVIYQTDCYIKKDNNKNPDELIYSGTVMDVPWYIADYELDKTPSGEPISSNKWWAPGMNFPEGSDYLEIYVKENN